MDDKKAKRASQLLKLKTDSELAIFDKLNELEDVIPLLQKRIEDVGAIDATTIRGKQGFPGKDGKNADESRVITEVLSKIRLPEDGHTPTKTELTALIKPLIPTVRDGIDADEKRVVREVLKLLPKPENGKDGKDADEDKIKEKIENDLPQLGESIRDGLELLQGEKRLDAKAIKNLALALPPIPSSPRIRVYENGVLQNEPLGSINFTGAGQTATQKGSDYTINIPGGGSGSSTKIKYLVASSTAPAETKAIADYVCTAASSGTTDDFQVQAAVTAAGVAGYAEVELTEGNFNFYNPVFSQKNNVHIKGRGVGITTIVAMYDSVTAGNSPNGLISIYDTSGVNAVNNSLVKDLSINLNNFRTSGIYLRGVYTSTKITNDITFSNLDIYGKKPENQGNIAGISIIGAGTPQGSIDNVLFDRVKIHDFSVIDSTNNCGYAINIGADSLDNVNFSGCYFYNLYGTTINLGSAVIRGRKNWVVQDNTFFNTGLRPDLGGRNCGDIYDTSRNGFSGIRILNNTFTSIKGTWDPTVNSNDNAVQFFNLLIYNSYDYVIDSNTFLNGSRVMAPGFSNPSGNESQNFLFSNNTVHNYLEFLDPDGSGIAKYTNNVFWNIYAGGIMGGYGNHYPSNYIDNLFVNCCILPSPDTTADIYKGIFLLEDGGNIVQGNTIYNDRQLTNPISVATLAASSTAGNPNGTYIYKVTFVTETGTETAGGTSSASITVANKQINLSTIPLGPVGTMARNIYRTAAGGADGTQKFVARLDFNTATTFTDNVSDTTLGYAVPTVNSTTNQLKYIFCESGGGRSNYDPNIYKDNIIIGSGPSVASFFLDSYFNHVITGNIGITETTIQNYQSSGVANITGLSSNDTVYANYKNNGIPVTSTTGIISTLPSGANRTGLTVNQNDTTNNPNAVLINNSTSSDAVRINQSGNGNPLNIQNSGGNRTEITRSVSGVNSFNPVLYVQASASNESVGALQVNVSNASSTGYGLQINNAGTGNSLQVNTNDFIVKGGKAAIGTSTLGAKFAVAGGYLALDSAQGIYLNGNADNNWRIGRNMSGAIAAAIATSSAIQLTTSSTSNEGVVIGINGGNSIAEFTGSGNTYIRSLSIGGLVKSNSGTLALAAAGTDYVTPTGSGAGLTGITTSVSNSDGTLTISPNTGAVIASLALAHSNTWISAQSFNSNIGSNFRPLTVTQNDTTNNPEGFRINNSGSGDSFYVNQSGGGKPLNIQNSGNQRTEITRSTTGINGFNPVLYVQGSSSTENTGVLNIVMSNAGASGYGLKIDNAGTGVALVISGKTSGTVSVSAPSVAGTTTFNLPGNNGVLGQALVTDGSGNTSWSATSQRTVRSISALRTLDATDSVILASGTFTVTLPTAVSITGRIYTIKNSSSGTITVATTSSQTIYTTAGGVSTLTLSQGVSYDVISDGSNWQTI